MAGSCPPRSSEEGEMDISSEDLVNLLDGYESLDLILDAPPDAELTQLSEETPSTAPTTEGEGRGPSVVADPFLKPSRSRRIKVEIEFLHAQINELETELASLSDGRSIITPVWQGIAARQRLKRTAAEAENAYLRTRLRRLIQVARSLQVVLGQSSRAQTSRQLDVRHPNEDCAWESDLGQVFRHFVVDVHRAHSSMDTVFGSQPPHQSARFYNSSAVKARVVNSVEHLYVETRQCFTIPFSFDRVSAIVWQAFTTQFERQRRQSEVYFSTNEMFACKVASNNFNVAESSSTKMAATILAKKFEENNQTTVVWRAFIAPGNEGLCDAVATTTGWLVLQPLEEPSDRSSVRVCLRTTPRNTDLFSLRHYSLVREPTTTNELGAFVSQKLCTLAEDLILVIEEIESILLVQS